MHVVPTACLSAYTQEVFIPSVRLESIDSSSEGNRLGSNGKHLQAAKGEKDPI